MNTPVTAAEWLAKQIGETWLKRELEPGNHGWAKFDVETMEDTCLGPVDFEEVAKEVEKIAVARGFNYGFTVEDEYDVDEDIHYKVIVWARKVSTNFQINLDVHKDELEPINTAISRDGDLAEYDCDICGGTRVWREPDGDVYDRELVKDCKCAARS